MALGTMIPLKTSGTADMQPVEKTRNKKDRNSPGKGAKQNAGEQNSQESDSFYKMYNKEIKVNQDEIPIILAELTDAAYNFISRENYEKALILLQKTEGVLEVSLTHAHSAGRQPRRMHAGPLHPVDHVQQHSDVLSKVSEPTD